MSNTTCPSDFIAHGDTGSIPGDVSRSSYSKSRPLKRQRNFRYAIKDVEAWCKEWIMEQRLIQGRIIFSHVMYWLIKLFHVNRRNAPSFLRTSICRQWPRDCWEIAVEPWALQYKHGWCCFDEADRMELNSRYFKSLAYGWWDGMGPEIIIGDEEPKIIIHDADNVEIVYISDDEEILIE